MKRALAYVGAALAALSLSFAAGRYSRPAEETKTQAVAATTASASAAHEETRETRAPERVVTRKVLVPCPPPAAPGAAPAQQALGGALLEETTIDRGPVVIDRVQDATSSSLAATTSSSTTKTTAQPRLMVGAKAGLAITDPTRVLYAAEAKYRFAGPVWVGVEGNTRGEAFVSIALTF